MKEFSLTIGDTTWSISTVGSEAWYQSGDWPLIGAIGTLAISNAVAIFIALYQQRVTRKSSEDFALRSTIEKRLEEFYNPLLALLSENREVFSKFGPSRIAGLESGDAVVAAEVWKEMKLGVIVQNNEKISSIIQSKSHLLSEGDDFEQYLRLKLHIDSYSIFLKVGSEVHEQFRFPIGIEDRVSKFRTEQIRELEATKG
ncbi:hypothetical protein [Phaeobacter sp. S60]|uniref:hypothetical protein n=1 Tax=Phaeobacter sp. S60 TaxID=1569353 RepID=UPI00058C600C|nr:hypothetical protein [Phaeobacter sp. S60]KII18036.1 hypothetical protein OO25_03405 [Phaeobacter sp. S60]